MNSKKRIAIDMDNVMADITDQFINWYHKKTGFRQTLANMVGVGEATSFPDPELARSFLFHSGFFRTAPVIADSQEVIRELNERYEVFIVSAAMEFPNSLGEKYDWLQEHFPYLTWQQIVFCGSKTIVQADYLIDDHLKNLDYFDGEKILYTAPHNQNIQKYTRVNNWKEVAAMLCAPVNL